MYQRILVPVDGSSTSTQGVTEAISIARLTGGQIRLLHVFSESLEAIGIEGAVYTGADIDKLLRQGGEQLLAKAMAPVKSQGIAVDSELLSSNGGRLCDLVVQVAKAWSADLIVVGTHGRRGAARLLLGSDAEQVLRMSPVPVLLVRGTDTRA